MAAFQFPDPAVQTTVVNPLTGSTYQWKEPPGKWVVTVSMRDVGDIIWEGDNPPDPIGDYKLWYSTDTLELYFHYCDTSGTCAWLPTSVPIQVLEDLNAFAAQAEVDIDQLQYKQQLLQNALDQIYLDQQGGSYVNKVGGDTMEGQLIINGPRKAGDDVDNPKLVSSVKVLSIDNAQNSSLQLRHSGNAKVYIGDTDISVASDIKFNRAVGSVVKTNVQDILNISEREIAYLGRSIEDEDLITKKYVDDTKDFLQNEIIELEEEIEAIAPSVERGKWTFTAVGTVGQPGQFTMYDDDFGNGNPTGLFKSAKSIWFNETDIGGTSHAFGDVDDGELLEIFIDGSPEFGLFEVVGQAHDETQGANSFWVVDVNFIRTNTATTAVGPGEICRFKIFMAPTGGDASSFVMKTGDTMTGKLQLDKPRGDSDNGDGFTIKGAIGNSYSSTTVSEQAGNLLQAYHNKDAPDAINYKGKIAGPQNIVTKQYVDASATVSLNCGGSAKWKKGSLNDSTLEGSRYFGIEQAGSTSSSIGVGNVLYLNKLINSEGALQQMDKYTPTDSSYCEVYLGNELVFKGQLKPSTYKVANRNPNDIVCDFSTQYALVSKGGSNWSQSSTYRLILTGMKYTG